MNEKIQAWLAIAGAVLGPIAVWYWRYVERRDQRHNKGFDILDKRDERAWQRIERELEETRNELREREKRIGEVERERDDGWDAARAWHGQAAEYHHHAATLCRMLNGMPEVTNKLDVPVMPHFRDLLNKRKQAPQG